jgi:hypothetical protein
MGGGNRGLLQGNIMALVGNAKEGLSKSLAIIKQLLNECGGYLVT